RPGGVVVEVLVRSAERVDAGSHRDGGQRRAVLPVDGDRVSIGGAAVGERAAQGERAILVDAGGAARDETVRPEAVDGSCITGTSIVEWCADENVVSTECHCRS